MFQLSSSIEISAISRKIFFRMPSTVPPVLPGANLSSVPRGSPSVTNYSHKSLANNAAIKLRGRRPTCARGFFRVEEDGWKLLLLKDVVVVEVGLLAAVAEDDGNYGDLERASPVKVFKVALLYTIGENAMRHGYYEFE